MCRCNGTTPTFCTNLAPSSRIVYDDSVSQWVGERLETKFSHCRAIGYEREGKLIAGVVYDEFNGANVNMHVAAEGTNWLARNYLRAVFGYPFNQLKVKRVTGLVASTNQRALDFDLHLGFTVEAVLKDAHPDGDLIVLVMRPESCRWIR